MANNEQNEYPTPVGKNSKRETAELLPRYFRTAANKKFLSSTLDQMMSPGVAEKINAYYGRKTAKAYKPGDKYVEDVSEQRQDRQLEPSTVYEDILGNVNFYKDYTDYVNQIKVFNGTIEDQSVLNGQEYYAWNPNIDWDKIVNYREYYWLPNGPQSIPVFGQSKEVQSTYTVTLEYNDGDPTYVFSPNGFSQNPSLKLYRGQTYKFEIDTPGHPIAFAVNRSFTPGTAIIVATQEGVKANGLFDGELYDFKSYDTGDFIIAPDEGGIVGFSEGNNASQGYTDGVTIYDEDGNAVAYEDQYGNRLSIVFVEKGTIEFTIPDNSPDALYYISKEDINASGLIKIYDIEENTFLDVENEIVGKKDYTSANGVKFSNGMKVYFQGEITPSLYSEGEYYVEGVGSQIVLIREKNLAIPADYAGLLSVEFDNFGFDRLPFGQADSYPIEKDYILINRASKDRNAWTRYNRWFHKSVIEESARINGQPVDIDQSARANRPIIEFEPGIKLYKFGTQAKTDIDLVDTFTKDVFSTIEGSAGYIIDGVQVTDGMRILFTADPDSFVNGKIFQVQFIVSQEGYAESRQIALREVEDSNPLENEVVLVTKGNENKGQLYYYDGESWFKAQEKTKVNQSPLFDIFDENSISYSNELYYPITDFKGNKVFSYKEGTGIKDTVLGFPLAYKSIENVGDILFNFDLLTDEYSFEQNQVRVSIKSDTGHLRKYKSRTDYVNQNGWTKVDKLSSQYVIRQYDVTDVLNNNFDIDVYDNAADLNDLKVVVYVDNKYQKEDVDYVINRINRKALIRFPNNLSTDQKILIKTKSSAVKNANGIYEMAYNYERNPLNENVKDFTLGEINDHVDTMIEEIRDFEGVYPGTSNLRDLGDLDVYGKKFLQHSGPINLSLYSITDKDSNIIKSIRYAKERYAEFKREFLNVAYNLGFTGPIKQHVDLIFKELNQNKKPTMPFYFSDMVPLGGARRLEYVILDSRSEFYGLTEKFDLENLSSKAVTVYLNQEQLIHGKDYIFTEEGFVRITAEKTLDDLVEIFEYTTTDGSYVPQTPTKLGLYPAFEPVKYTDTTYREPMDVIQGHDGSIIKAFNDYRDDLILELEKRIYNNIKIRYNTDIFDINNFVKGINRDTLISKDNLNKVMLTDFISWVRTAGDVDYTDNNFYLRTDSFTYNYSAMGDPNGNSLPGFWRAVYKEAYDTDRPHTHPWEMLGFYVKPSWWEDTYGPAPYTSDNLILWKDLSEGRVKDPTKPVEIKQKYIRPNLMEYIPTDSQGNLRSPLDTSFARGYIAKLAQGIYKFGDEAPVETAWRRSSEYPFSLITSFILNKPNAVIGVGFDLSRIKRNLVGNLVYTETNKSITLKDLKFPNTYNDSERVFTSGLVNYINSYMASDVTTSYEKYKEYLTNLNNKLSIKVGGFTDKDKFQLILESRTPYNQGNVFVPIENYKIFLNTSSPIEAITYSGVIIERLGNGYKILGYDYDNPYFIYYPPFETQNDPAFNIGGVSEEYVNWEPGKQYVSGINVRFNNSYFRCKQSHISATTIDDTKFAPLPYLPTIGGRDALLRRNFYDGQETVLPYGTVLETVQEVADFLQGYSRYLTTNGFTFDYFNKETEALEDWLLSVKEFMFWTTQNWAEGSAIALSPSAQTLKFYRDNAVVDNVFDPFYGYTLLKADGAKLKQEFGNIYRDTLNNFNLSVKNTADGIYSIVLPLVQKEHVVILDNETVFNDTIYDLDAGYRQERIKVVGYRADGWTGGLNIEGFFYDNAIVTEWAAWTDYQIGDVVKHKEYYYSASNNIQGTETFSPALWYKLDEKPESTLYTNFDYKTNQFTDFFDLDSDNFDKGQQKVAQHTIGYQKRKYLENIINDDVSQYKFYQGMIQDKGTKNVLTKLFDALSNADKDSLEFYEEWAVRIGRYGATEAFSEVEYLLDEEQFKLSPQPVQLVNRLPQNKTDLIYRIPEYETYNSPSEYDHKPFPTKYSDSEYVKTIGYARGDDVTYRVLTQLELLDTNVSTVPLGSYIWIIDNGISDWNMLQYIKYDYTVQEVATDPGQIDSIFGVEGTANIIVDKSVNDIQAGDIIAVDGYLDANNSFFEVVSVKNNNILCNPSTIREPENTVYTDANFDAKPIVTGFRTVRIDSIENVNRLVENYLDKNQKIWIDSDSNGRWKVIQHESQFQENDTLINPAEFDSSLTDYSSAIDVTNNNQTLLVGAPGDAQGKVYVYQRSSESLNLRFAEILEPDTFITDSLTPQEFGKSVSVSPDGRYVVVGAPGVSNVKTKYLGEYSKQTQYNKGDIVSYSDSLWKTNRVVYPEIASVQYTSFDSYAFFSTYNTLNEQLLLKVGDYGIDLQTDHLLIRAPIDQYNGTEAGNKIVLEWNNYSVVYDTANLISQQPFSGLIPQITSNFLTDTHEIIQKIDHVFSIESYTNLPQIGTRLTSATGSGLVYRIKFDQSSAVIYVTNVNGIFDITDVIYTDTGALIGTYYEEGYNFNPRIGGYWMISTPLYDNNVILEDAGKGLVYKDVLTAGESVTDKKYVNIQNSIQLLNSTSVTNRVSEIIALTYQGDPGGIFALQPSKKIVIRGPRTYTDALTAGDTFNFWLRDTEYQGSQIDFTNNSLNLAILNKEHEVVDLWDGYIDLTYQINEQGNIFEIEVGDIIEDVQFLSDGQGGVSQVDVSTSTAEVVYVQKIFNSARIYIKNKTGSFEQQPNIALYQIRRKADLAKDPTYAIDRLVANVVDTENSINVGNNTVGKLIVIENEDDLILETEMSIVNEEYWFYNEDIISGIPREANIPFTANKDWQQVYNIPIDSNGYSSPYLNQGVFYVFRKNGNVYVQDNIFTTTQLIDNRRLGESVKITKVDDLYTLLVHSKGDGNYGNAGRIDFIKKGIEDDIVYDWELSVDRNYRGIHNPENNYREGQLVVYNNKLYEAITNIDTGEPFNLTLWTEADDNLDYIGHIPNNDFTLFEDTQWKPEENILEFGASFDISENSEVLAITSRQEEQDSVTDTRVLIYRKYKNRYLLTQTIKAETNNNEFARSINLNSDGTLLAIGEPYNDSVKIDQGIIYIYKSVNGEFILHQTLQSPSNEKVEMFGYTVNFDGDTLAVTSLNGNLVANTSFDEYSSLDPNSTSLYGTYLVNDPTSAESESSTTFDNGLTKFNNENVDSGCVYVYENVDGYLIFGEKFEYDNIDSIWFGENLLVKRNHVYVGMPKINKYDVYQGILVDYRKNPTRNIYTTIRQPVEQVDLDSIKSVFLYNTKTEEIITYLDYIDPVQGKVVGVAEQEISFKTYYDPALYNQTPIGQLYSETSAWGSNHVGKVWWDLSSVRFLNSYQGDSLFQSQNWNTVVPRTDIEVWEWVESDLPPTEYLNQADSAVGLVNGITGTPKYDTSFSTELKYDNISGSFSTKYYFWVKNKTTVPNISSRNFSVADIKNLIKDPKGLGYRFVAFLGDDRFMLANCESLLKDKEVAINIRYWNIEDKDINIHREYQLLTEGLETSKPKRDIEKKWFDSLVGYDEQFRIVPDPNLPVKQKYGVESRPRQGMFENRIEALKQVIERINLELSEVLLIDDFDLSPLHSSEPVPAAEERLYDIVIDIEDELSFVGVTKTTQAKVSPVIVDGEIIALDIVDPGRGYKVVPTYRIDGVGSGAVFEFTLDSIGKISSATVIKSGSGYLDNTTIDIRKFSVLVNSDSTVKNKWAIYEWKDLENIWFRTRVQDFDVTLFWEYIDWYDDGINQFTEVDYDIDYTYQLALIDDNIGDIVKVNNVGTGGWLLLEKVDNIESVDYTLKYNVVGRQNGTIKFLDNIYDLAGNLVGFDAATFDNKFYDDTPVKEIRIILETIKNNIYVDELSIKYNELFLASIRYVLSEQRNVDWVFKTSFVKAKHNLGTLQQKISYQNDNLESYEDYINEVKPFKTNIREYLSAYDAIDDTNTLVADFDLPPRYDDRYKGIVTKPYKTSASGIFGLDGDENTYPDKNWYDNVGYKLTSIEIKDGGTGYLIPPVVKIVGEARRPAKAIAYITRGSISKISITDPGDGYLSLPEIIIEGTQSEGSLPPLLGPILGDSVVRTASIIAKFDRVSSTFEIDNLQEIEYFVGSNVQEYYTLKWPMDLRTKEVEIYVNGFKSLFSEYSYENILDDSLGFDRYLGRIRFNKLPDTGDNIEVRYKKNVDILKATDRINLFYESLPGMLGKDISQLMDGVDYGGVQVKSFAFSGPSGWDTDGWFTTSWDVYDNTFEDEIFRLDGSTIILELSKPLEDGVDYNIYLNNVRIDDPNFDTGTPANPNAIVNTIAGDGVTTIINLQELGIDTTLDDLVTIRKITSDGSFLPDSDSYDMDLSGGALDYANAKGILAEEMIVDGDSFVTPTTSKGPEELIPGQVLDTVDIKVYDRPNDGSSPIFNQNYITDGTTKEYDLGLYPNSNDAVWIKLDNVKVDNNDYTIDYINQKLVFNQPPTANQHLSIISVGINGINILDIDTYITDGTAQEFESRVQYQDRVNTYTTLDGNPVDVSLSESENGMFTIKFASAPDANQVVKFGIFSDIDQQNFSIVLKNTFAGDGSTTVFDLVEQSFYSEPLRYNMIVKVDNEVLNSGYNRQFVVSNVREYQLETFQQPGISLDADNIIVYLNGEQIIITQKWRLDIFNSSVVLFDDVGVDGDILEVFVVDDGEYLVDGNQVTLDVAPSEDAIIEIYQFNNHDIQKIERQKYDVVARSTLTAGTEEYYTYNRLTAGVIELRNSVIDAKYAWVILNGTMLSPEVDYYLTEDRKFINIKQKISENDTIEVFAFTNEILIEKIAFRQFKDILNRVHFKRIDNEQDFILAQDLNYYDLTIELVDATDLPQPSKANNIPGVIFIEGERIEYFVKEDNTLRQLRRGTLGTGIKNIYTAGTRVVDQGIGKNIPYRDETLSQVFTADGTANSFALDFTPNSVNEFEVFVGGKRLRKNEISSYNITIDQDSPAGDEILPAEFTINGSNLELLSTPIENQRIIVVRRLGLIWNDPDTPLSRTDNDIARFLRAGTSLLPK